MACITNGKMHASFICLIAAILISGIYGESSNLERSDVPVQNDQLKIEDIWDALSQPVPTDESDNIDPPLTEPETSDSCGVNLCFGLDGSGSITEGEYEAQKDLIKDVASVAARDPDATYSAVQYGLKLIRISTQVNDISLFRESVDASELASASRTFISAGIASCLRMLSGTTSGANAIVVLGDGRSNFATATLPSVLEKAENATLFAVGIGFPRDAELLLQITGGNDERVFDVRKYSDLQNIASRLAEGVCELHT